MSAPRPDMDGIFLPDKAVCELCGEPMPAGEEMFQFHGYSGPCPKPPMNAPRPEGMSDKLRCRNCGRAECMGPIVCAADMSPSARELKRLNGELDRLRADRATLKVRADEALAAHSASFGALQTLSAALFDGEVDDYTALVEKIIARVRPLEADGATLREELVSGRAQWQQERDEYRQIVEFSEAELATLRERVRKLPSPTWRQLMGSVVQDGKAIVSYRVGCDWCDWKDIQVSPPEHPEHPDNGCLWSDVHKDAK